MTIQVTIKNDDDRPDHAIKVYGNTPGESIALDEAKPFIVVNAGQTGAFYVWSGQDLVIREAIGSNGS